MDLTQLEKGFELKKKLDWIKARRKDVDSSVVIQLGSTRLDNYGDYHNRLSEALSDELCRIEAEILKEIIEL